MISLVAAFAAYEAIQHAPTDSFTGTPKQAAQTAVPTTTPAAAPAMHELDPADQAVLVQLHQSTLWIVPAAQALMGKTDVSMVRDPAGMLVGEHQTLDPEVTSTAALLGIALPDKTSADRLTMNAKIVNSGSDYVPVAVNVMRREQGELLKLVVADRVVTDNELIRHLDDQATLALERSVAYTEASGLVDYTQLNQGNAVVQEIAASLDIPTIITAAAVLAVISILSAVFLRLLVRRNRSSKGTA